MLDFRRHSLFVALLGVTPLLVSFGPIAEAQTATPSAVERVMPLLDLQALVDDAKAKKNSRVTIPAGTYRVTTDKVQLDGINDFVLDGTGATLLFPNPASWALGVSNCRNITLRGFTIDYQTLPFTQGSITQKAPDGSWVQFKIHDGYPQLSSAFSGNQTHAFDRASRNWKIGLPDLYGKTEILSPTEGKVTFFRIPANIDKFEVGDFLVLNTRRSGAVDLRDSETIRMEDVTVLSSPGLGISSRHLGGDNYFRCTVKRGPRPLGATEDRLLSTGADAFNYADSRRGPTLEKCDFSYMGDDSVNLHGPSWPVLKVEGNSVWTATFVGPRPYKDDMVPGDVVRVMTPGNFVVRSQGTLASWEDNVPANGLEITPELWKKIWPQRALGNRTTFYKINFKEPVDVQVGDTIDFPAANTPGYVIRDSYFHDHRARGLRLQGSDGLIENNRFERLKGGAIAIGPELVYWREAGWPIRVVIRGNTIKDVGQGADVTLPSSFTPGAISLYARLESKDQTFGHEIRDVQILNNTIDGSSVAGIHVNASRHVIVSGNRISNVNTRTTPQTGSDYNLNSASPITVQNSEDVRVENNTVAANMEVPLAAPVKTVALAQQSATVATGTQVATTLAPTQPAQTAIVSHIGDNPGGWQWRWTQDTGRRDVAQTFTAPSDFTLDKIAMAIRSGSTADTSRAPFSLTLSRFADARATTPSEQLASWSGVLPPNDQGTAYSQGAWLTFDIPDFKLQPGQVYGFTLKFDAPKATGQGIVFSVPQTEEYAGGRSLFSTDGQNWQPNYDFNFLLIAAGAETPIVNHVARVLEVNRNGGAEFKTVAAAAKIAQAGDTIRLAPGSGPYHEILYIPASGTAQAPITVEGNGNLITGFEPLTGWTTTNGVTTCRLPAFPCVLTYKGERLVQDYTTKQFTKYATLNDAKDTLTLLSGTSTDGWEVSKRPFVVQISNGSYQTFRNLRASGSNNDGFNLHGAGQGLIFENIEGFHNLDEGYSAHDDIVSEIRGGKFWGNDNGVANVGKSDTKVTQVDTYANMGFGFWLNDCRGNLKQLRSWGNGAEQVRFRSATVAVDDVQAFTPPSATRPWVSYMESATSPSCKVYSENNSQLTGAVTVRPEVAPVG